MQYSNGCKLKSVNHILLGFEVQQGHWQPHGLEFSETAGVGVSVLSVDLSSLLYLFCKV